MRRRAAFSLIVERDTARRTLWASSLSDNGDMRVMRRARPSEAESLITPDVQIATMIVGLSAQGDREMIELITRVRGAADDAVIIAIDHGTDPETAAQVLDAGADDYLRADHHPSEFAARLRIRSHRPGVEQPQSSRRAGLGLTPIEDRILDHLATRRGEIVTRSALAVGVGQGDWTYGDRKFDVHIARIRQKLNKCYGNSVTVRTIRSRGYLLESETPI